MNTIIGKTLLAVSLSLMLGACGDKNTGETNAAATDKAVLISVQQARISDLPIWVDSVGYVRSRSAPTLAAEVAGRITMVKADTGDAIETGQLLAETDTSTLLLQQQAAQAQIERLLVHIANGERRVERFAKLTARNLSSQTQLDDAREQLEAYRAEHKAAVAQLAIVQDSLDKSRIVAPVSGVIQNRLIATGDFVNRGQPLFEITQPDQLQAWLPFPESLALKVHIGQAVEIFSPLTPGETIESAITELQPTVGAGSRAVMAIIDIGSPGNLRPGATLTAKALVETHKAAVLVPTISVVRRPAGDLVYVIDDDMAKARLVETGEYEGALVEILSGLSGNETIATDGAAFLSDGARVTIRRPQN